MLNAIATFYFHAHRSKIFTAVCALVLATSVALLAAARPKGQEDLQVYELNDKISLSASIDHYFNVRGKLMPAGRYQSEARSGSIRLAASKYVPIQLDTRTEPIFVLDDNIPAPKADSFVSFVGRLNTASDPVVSYFLEVDSPTNVPLINRLASAGMLVAALTLLVLGVGYLVSRNDYALSTNHNMGAANAATHLSTSPTLWFGNLGARYQNAMTNQAPVQLNPTARDLTFESTGTEPWAIVIKRITQTQPTHIATRYGALPAVRLSFEDERGLLRKGVLVAGEEILKRFSQ